MKWAIINKCAEETGFTYVLTYDPDSRSIKWHHVYMERLLHKFTTLILKECIKCIESADENSIFTAETAGIVGAAHARSIENIKRHFELSEFDMKEWQKK